jgi:sec-independent protein translocase protein TatC
MSELNNENLDSIPITKHRLVDQLLALRQCLLSCLIITGCVFICLLFFANTLFEWVATPLLAQLPAQSHMIATNVTGAFVAPIKLTFFLSLYIAIPLLLYQCWRFLAPGLYQHEKRLVWPLLLLSTGLFYLGVAFCYFVIFPIIFQFFIFTAPEGIAVMPDITQFVSFALKLFFAFGLSFEVPIITLLCVWSGITSITSLREKRPYMLVLAFVIGMFLTPPDVLSQTLLAIPLYLLFEAGILLAKFFPMPSRLRDNRSPD